MNFERLKRFVDKRDLFLDLVSLILKSNIKLLSTDFSPFETANIRADLYRDALKLATAAGMAEWAAEETAHLCAACI